MKGDGSRQKKGKKAKTVSKNITDIVNQAEIQSEAGGETESKSTTETLNENGEEAKSDDSGDKNTETDNSKKSELENASSTSISTSETTDTTNVLSEHESDYVNQQGVRFIQDGPNGLNSANVPYGLPCIRELLRFLISLINFKNSDMMISMGLNLLTIGFESGVDHISTYQSLLAYVKDDLCKNLFNLLSSEKLSIYASVLRATFLLFESLRSHLKLQLEHFFIKLMEIMVSDSNRISQEQKEMTIDYLVQFLRIPGFSTELYLNYDCSLNCTNLFESLTKLLSKVIY